MMDPLLITDMLNYYSKIAKEYESTGNRLGHEASAQEVEAALAKDPRLKETMLVLADTKGTMAELYRMYARTLRVLGQLQADLVKGLPDENRNSSGSVPGSGAPQGAPGSSEPR